MKNHAHQAIRLANAQAPSESTKAIGILTLHRKPRTEHRTHVYSYANDRPVSAAKATASPANTTGATLTHKSGVTAKTHHRAVANARPRLTGLAARQEAARIFCSVLKSAGQLTADRSRRAYAALNAS